MAYLFALIYVAITVGAGTYLVITEHYGWAWIPFLLTLSLSVHHKD